MNLNHGVPGKRASVPVLAFMSGLMNPTVVVNAGPMAVAASIFLCGWTGWIPTVWLTSTWAAVSSNWPRGPGRSPRRAPSKRTWPWNTHTPMSVATSSSVSAGTRSQGQKDGETKWFDQVYLTAPEMDHVRKLVVADLQAQGFIERPASESKRSPNRQTPGQQRPPRRTPEGDDLSEYRTPDDGIDDIPL